MLQQFMCVSRLLSARELCGVWSELSTMRSAVSLLRGTLPALFEARSAVLCELETQLRAMALPFVCEAFEEHDYRAFRRYAPMFGAAQLTEEWLLNRLAQAKLLCEAKEWRCLGEAVAFAQRELDWNLQVQPDRDTALRLTTQLCQGVCTEMAIQLKHGPCKHMAQLLKSIESARARSLVRNAQPPPVCQGGCARCTAAL